MLQKAESIRMEITRKASKVTVTWNCSDEYAAMLFYDELVSAAERGNAVITAKVANRYDVPPSSGKRP